MASQGGGKAKALCIGVNYIGTDNALRGCINDANNSHDKFKSMARSAGFKDIETKLITDETEVKPNRDDIIRGLNWLVKDAKAGDLLWFHFSGHGTQVRDRDGDEKDGKDEAICPLDLKMISDDELKAFLCGTLPEGVTLYAIFDCCHSGTIVDLHYCWDESSSKFVRDSYNAQTHADIFMISGCMNAQTSADLPPGYEADIKESVGALTNGILKNIEKGYSWATFVTEVRRALKNSRLTQIPQFEVGRLEDATVPAFTRLLPGGVEPTPPPEDLEPMDPPPPNHHVEDISQGGGPHDNDTDFLPFSDLSGFASILMQKGLQMIMGGGDGNGNTGSRQMKQGLLAKLFGCFGGGSKKQ